MAIYLNSPNNNKINRAPPNPGLANKKRKQNMKEKKMNEDKTFGDEV